MRQQGDLRAVLAIVLVLATAGVLGQGVPPAAAEPECPLSPAALAITNKNYPRLDPPLSSTDAAPVVQLNGTFDAYELGGALQCGTLADFVAAADAGGLYANVHTVDSPGGLARGQLERVEGAGGGVATYRVEMSGLKQVSNGTVVPVDTPTAGTLLLRVDPARDLATWELNVTSVDAMISSHVHGGNTTSNGPAVVLLAPAQPPLQAPAAPPPGQQSGGAPPPQQSPGAAPRGASALHFALAAAAGAAWLLA